MPTGMQCHAWRQADGAPLAVELRWLAAIYKCTVVLLVLVDRLLVVVAGSTSTPGRGVLLHLFLNIYVVVVPPPEECSVISIRIFIGLLNLPQKSAVAQPSECALPHGEQLQK